MNSTIEHINAAKRVVQYLAGTPYMGLFFHPGQYNDLLGFSDSSWGDDTATSQSTGSYIFKLFKGPVVWYSKLQEIIA